MYTVTPSGAADSNYSISFVTSTFSITKAALTVTGLTGNNKVFDGTTLASASGTASLLGVIGADAVALGGSPVFTFATANIGTGITITTTGYTLSGGDSGNYTLTQPTLSADITSTLSNDDFSKLSFEFYPNPTTSKVNISIPVEKVTIYNITGKKVFETNKSTFHIETLQNGIYVLQIQSEKGTATRKLIKK